MNLSDKNIEIMELLAIYKFLTISQMVRLGVSEHKESIRRMLKRFNSTPKGLIAKKSFPVHYEKGRLEDIYSLTKKGAYFLADVKDLEFNKIEYATGKKLFFHDYAHRIATIDYHIQLREVLKEKNQTLDFIEFYFQKEGNNSTKNSKERLRAKTRIDFVDGGHITPDIIYKYSDQEEDYLFCVEILMDQDTNRALEQIDNHIVAITQGAVSDKYDFKRDNRVIYVFAENSTKDAIEKKFLNDSKYVKWVKYFIFSQYE